jgi:hypothetical protein
MRISVAIRHRMPIVLALLAGAAAWPSGTAAAVAAEPQTAPAAASPAPAASGPSSPAPAAVDAVAATPAAPAAPAVTPVGDVAAAAPPPAADPAVAAPPLAADPAMAAPLAAAVPPAVSAVPALPAVPVPPAAAVAGPALPASIAARSLYLLNGAAAAYDAAGTADPWSVLPRTSGVLVTGAYVAGYGGRPGEAFVGPGSNGSQGVFRIEGFEVGDAASSGMSVGVSALTAEQVEVTTGGADPAVLSPGLQINLAQRRGTNEWRATARGLGSGGPLAAGAPAVHGLAAGQAASEQVSGDRVRATATAGAEVGGPLRQDALWLWGGLDRGWTALSAFGGQRFSLSDLAGAAKLDARLTAANSATLAWTRASRTADGEGAGPDRAPATTLDRHGHGDVWRLVDTAILSPRLYVTATAGRVDVASQALPRGGLGTPLELDAAGVAHGSWYADEESGNTGAASLQVSDSGQLAGTASELRLAGEWRRTLEAARFQAPDWAQITAGSVLDLPSTLNALDVWRDGSTRDTVTREGLWGADTLRWSRVTAEFGLRFDHQTPRNLPSSVGGVPGVALLPAVAFGGNDADGIHWDSLAPRLALAWAPAATPRLLLRASLARFASQLGGAIPARVDPAAPASAAFYAPASPGAGQGLTFWYPNGFDPHLPPGVPANALDPHLRPELTDEAIVGAEQALGSDGVVGLQLAWRRTTGLLEDRLLVRDAASGEVRVATARDWVAEPPETGTLPGGAPFSGPYYDLRPGLAPTGGTLLVNGDRRQRLLGATLEWRQRLARRWTTLGHLVWQDWTWQIGPNYRRYADPTAALVDGDYNGQPVAGQSLPGGRPLYLSSQWSFDLSAAVQLPGALSAAVAINGRQGFPLAYYRTVARNNAGPVDLRLTGQVDAFRSDDLVSCDVRLDKDIAASSDVAVALSLEGLNLLTSGQVLRRETNLGVGRANFVDQVITPRLLRLGLKLQFR